MNIVTTLGRAFSSNLQAISISEEERTTMAASGVVEPTSQRYLVWRRAIIVVVLTATFLSAGVTTYRYVTEEDDEANLIESITETVVAKMETMVPGAATLTAKATAKSADTEKTENDESNDKPLIGRIVDAVELLSLYALPLAAGAVFLLGNRLKLSFKILAAGFSIGFLMPMALGMLPWSVWGQPEVAISPEKEPVAYVKNEVEGIMEGISYLLMLLPTVLSLIPGALKSCLRLKTLLPTSLLPGWFIVVASALYSLFVLVVFVAVDQVTSQPLILGGLFLFMLASLIPALRSSAFTSPLLTEEDHRRFKNVQRVVGLVTLLAGCCFAAFVLTRDVYGYRVLGLDPAKSLIRPIDLVEFLFQLISKSLFVTLLGAELFMRMNLSAWKKGLALASSEQGPESDRVMQALENVSNEQPAAA
jgi:hypothetical protein